MHTKFTYIYIYMHKSRSKTRKNPDVRMIPRIRLGFFHHSSQTGLDPSWGHASSLSDSVGVSLSKMGSAKVAVGICFGNPARLRVYTYTLVLAGVNVQAAVPGPVIKHAKSSVASELGAKQTCGPRTPRRLKVQT